MNNFKEFYIKILETAVDAIVVLNEEGEVVFWNKAAENFFGYRKEEIIGKNCHLMLCHPLDYERAKKAFENFIKTKESPLTGKTVEVIGYDKEGKAVNLEISISSFEYKEETYFVGIIRKKREFDKISISHDYFIETILDAIPVPVFIKDENLKYTFVNKAFEEFTGVTKAQAKGKTVFEVYPKDLATVYHSQDIKILDRAQKQVYTFKMKNIKGPPREVEIHKASFTDESGKVIGIIGLFCDIQERQELLRELEKKKLEIEDALAAKTRFLSYMGHELRTPLNNIMGFANVLKNTQLSYQQKEYLEGILNASESLLNIISNILDLSKLEIHELQINPTVTNLPNLILSIADMVKFDCYLKGLEFHVFISPILPDEVIVDGLRLKQVLLNLLSNAIKYTNKGHIELSVICEKDPSLPNKTKVKFTVSDTGIGISEEDINIIFDPFKVVERKKIVKGTGIGLSIIKKILELMGSEIKVKSQVGKGSIFYFILNLEIVKETAEQYFDIFKDKCIMLLLNMDRRFVTLMNYLLYWGFEPLIPTTYEEMSQLIPENKKIDFLIIDKDLNFMELKEALSIIEKLKKEEKLNYAIMFYKPTDNVENLLKITESSIDTFLQKPVNPIRLLNLFQKTTEKEKYPKLVIDKQYSYHKDELKILIVDDVQANIKLLKHLLKQKISNPIIKEAINGEEAVILYERETPDIIFMDLQMPIMDGFEAVRIIRNREETKGIKPVPIIAVSANYNIEERKKALLNGFTDYLTKPIILSELEGLLEKYIFNKSLNDKKIEAKKETNAVRIDFEYFRVNNLDKEFISNIFKISLSSIPQYIEDLVLNYKQGEFEKLKKSAHKLKGAAFSAGFKRLSELSDYLNKADLNEMNESELDERIREIFEEWEFLKKEISRYLENE